MGVYLNTDEIKEKLTKMVNTGLAFNISIEIECGYEKHHILHKLTESIKYNIKERNTDFVKDLQEARKIIKQWKRAEK